MNKVILLKAKNLLNALKKFGTCIIYYLNSVFIKLLWIKIGVKYILFSIWLIVSCKIYVKIILWNLKNGFMKKIKVI